MKVEVPSVRVNDDKSLPLVSEPLASDAVPSEIASDPRSFKEDRVPAVNVAVPSVRNAALSDPRKRDAVPSDIECASNDCTADSVPLVIVAVPSVNVTKANH